MQTNIITNRTSLPSLTAKAIARLDSTGAIFAVVAVTSRFRDGGSSPNPEDWVDTIFVDAMESLSLVHQSPRPETQIFSMKGKESRGRFTPTMGIYADAHRQITELSAGGFWVAIEMGKGMTSKRQMTIVSRLTKNWVLKDDAETQVWRSLPISQEARQFSEVYHNCLPELLELAPLFGGISRESLPVMGQVSDARMLDSIAKERDFQGGRNHGNRRRQPLTHNDIAAHLAALPEPEQARLTEMAARLRAGANS